MDQDTGTQRRPSSYEDVSLNSGLYCLSANTSDIGTFSIYLFVADLVCPGFCKTSADDKQFSVSNLVKTLSPILHRSGHHKLSSCSALMLLLYLNIPLVPSKNCHYPVIT